MKSKGQLSKEEKKAVLVRKIGMYKGPGAAVSRGKAQVTGGQEARRVMCGKGWGWRGGQGQKAPALQATLRV